jgi:hypothetical protein
MIEPPLIEQGSWTNADWVTIKGIEGRELEFQSIFRYLEPFGNELGQNH